MHILGHVCPDRKCSLTRSLRPGCGSTAVAEEEKEE